jgi:putative ABC transport system substrate-binding protein
VRRRSLLRAVAGVAAAAALPGLAAAAARRPFRILMILWRGETGVERGFRRQLNELGVIADCEIRDLDRQLGRLPAVLDEARRTRPDLVYTWGTGITLGTVGHWREADPSRHLADLPVVFTMVSAPLETGLQPPPDMPPRRNLTGVSHIAPLRVQINAIRAYLALERLGIVYNPQEENSVANVRSLRDEASATGFRLFEASVPACADGLPDPAAIPGLVQDLARRGVQVLYIGPDNFIGANRNLLTAAGLDAGIPCFTATELEIREGEAMIGLVSRYEAVGRLAAIKAKQVLVDGDAPSGVPIETLKRFSYIIRLPIALRLKLYPPLQLLDYAEVIR